MVVTYSLDDVATQLGCKPRWLADGIRAGKFPARKIGFHWRMTDTDIQAVLDAVKNPTVDTGLSLTRTSRRRHA